MEARGEINHRPNQSQGSDMASAQIEDLPLSPIPQPNVPETTHESPIESNDLSSSTATNDLLNNTPIPLPDVPTAHENPIGSNNSTISGPSNDSSSLQPPELITLHETPIESINCSMNSSYEDFNSSLPVGDCPQGERSGTSSQPAGAGTLNDNTSNDREDQNSTGSSSKKTGTWAVNENMYNMRNPAVKRLLREAKELSEPNPDLHAQPLDDNLFEWHFTVRGPPDSEFERGIYHGRIILPADYPMKPPAIMLLTPNGRFEIGNKICLSISSYHPETWRPSWSIRTALLALVSFMSTPAMGAVGSLDCTPDVRRKMAVRSRAFVCDSCGPVLHLMECTVPKSEAGNSGALRVFRMPHDGTGVHDPMRPPEASIISRFLPQILRNFHLNPGMRNRMIAQDGDVPPEIQVPRIEIDGPPEDAEVIVIPLNHPANVAFRITVGTIVVIICGIVIRRICNGDWSDWMDRYYRRL